MNELQQATARAIVNVFETGRVLGNYAGIAVIKGDKGHLSYGRNQAALGSGTLFKLLDSYCLQPKAQFAEQLRPYLPRFQAKDPTLDTDSQVRKWLGEAGNLDPVMRMTQDQFFDRLFLAPACTAAEALGITDPLGQTVVYDSYIQGGWAKVKVRVGAPTAGKSRDWVGKYVAARTAWLKSQVPPLPNTAYRMTSFKALIDANKWNLELPLNAHGVTITEAALEDPTTGGKPRDLNLTTPYLQGDDVLAVQRALAARGLPASQDKVFGPFTARLVTQWKKDKNISEVGESNSKEVVGPLTRASLGL